MRKRRKIKVLEKRGENQPVVPERFWHWIQHQKLVDPTRFVDFSSMYFRRRHCPSGKRGYSRDNQPGKLRFTFGISAGLDDI